MSAETKAFLIGAAAGILGAYAFFALAIRVPLPLIDTPETRAAIPSATGAVAVP